MGLYPSTLLRTKQVSSKNSEISEKVALRCSKTFFWTILKFASLQIQNFSFGLKHWICDRFASLRMVTEKILIRAQSFLFQFFRDLNLSLSLAAKSTYYGPFQPHPSTLPTPLRSRPVPLTLAENLMIYCKEMSSKAFNHDQNRNRQGTM